MSISPTLKKYLEKENIAYQWIHHPEEFEASKIAAQQHIPGHQMVKSVLVKADGQYVLCVLPATYLVDLEKLKKHLKSKDVKLASETEIAKLFPDFEVGAEPPFGNLYGLQVFSDSHVEDNDDIVFNAGTHTDIIRMKLKDFMRVTKPMRADFGKHI